MPPTPTQPARRTQGRRMVGAALAGVTAGVAVFVAIALWAGSGDVDVNLGDDVFRVGRVTALAAAVDEDGPLLFSDVAGGQRDVYVHHLGDAPDTGWVAFDARPPGAGRECFVRWQPERRRFADPCGSGTYPPDGGGLPHYRTAVEEGALLVDLRQPAP